MIGERIHRARKAAGLALRDLAEKVNVSHTWINKYEKDEAMPDSSTLLKLSKALGVRTEYFFRPQKVTLEHVEYRKRSSLSKKRLQAITHEILDLIERRMELEGLFPKPPVETFKLPANIPDQINDYEQIEILANAVRHEWALGTNPIPSLIDLLEIKGVRVFCIDAREDTKFDGLFAQVADAPVIVVGQYWPADRQRFTLAHELGHLLLAERLAEGLNEEKACNRFAGAFLFPDSSVKTYLGEKRSSLELQELNGIKQEFGLSMQGIIYRALQLEIIKPSYAKSLTIFFSKKGWRTQEPGKTLEPEISRIFSNLVFRALAEQYIGDSKAAELLGWSLDCFRRYRKMEELNATSC